MARDVSGGVKNSVANVNARYTKGDIVKYIKPEKLRELAVQDTYGFPLLDEDGKMQYFVGIVNIKSSYFREYSIAEAQLYLDQNWRERFDMKKLASAASLSQYHLAKLFKRHVGQTPYEYYRHKKIEKLQEMLTRPNITISEAFRECGIDYKSQYGRYFKEIVGMTPSEYREKVK